MEMRCTKDVLLVQYEIFEKIRRFDYVKNEPFSRVLNLEN